MQQKSVLHASCLAYELSATKTLFHDLSLNIQPGDRIGLVGVNGVGKSTLLKLLARQLQPTSGTITSTGTIHYLPQISQVQRAIAPQTVLGFLSNAIEEWWVVTQWLEERFDTVLDLEQSINNLSGGEFTRLMLAIALAQQPDVLLLDEPTNHLDFWALHQLQTQLQTFPEAFVIVSHKPFFLDQVVNTIWELTPTELKVYGGNHTFYQTKKESDRQAAIRTHETAQKELKQAKAALQAELTRATRSQRDGHRHAIASGMGKMARDYYANRASSNAGATKLKHQAAVAQATQAVEATKQFVPKATQVVLREASPKRRTLVELQNTRLLREDRCLIESATLTLKTGDRLAILGANGSGKSSLIQAILGTETGNTSARLVGEWVQTANPMRVVYLDQSYALIDRHQTLLENMRSANPDLDYQVLRQQLGHFLFFEDAIHKPAAVLSGGELARLAIALISISTIDLLVLDEPTNNLDWDTVQQMVTGLNRFEGAMWIISHDLEFLSQVSVTQAYTLQNCTLHAMHHLPNEPDAFYQEVLQLTN
ncbi:ABC-F family ATP-binding cassette domain-containing protein [Oscillatoria sp. FACHB-1407]|uniref:ribosomal protection-like ABC-F family protein n=1 Tax=Oscillatoria sp. FACHB-1407 TaxID=2692847 RepID=UPI00168378A9|nr:ATP-binding cassette domain-containing protein [Oscillatoria sp. FACHB-1407]MBD2462472.1 ABC-F family ATP-binding cassette domain-containing protein [Oscillatoria sp. FACHB-1407]